MNIGIFTDTYYPQINGTSTSSMILKRELEKLGHNVYLFTTTDPKAEPDSTVIRAFSVPFIFLRTHRVALPPPHILLKIRKYKLDIIHTQTEFSMGILGHLAAKIYRIPQIHTYHTMYVNYVHYIAKGHLITPKMAVNYSRNFCSSTCVTVTPSQKSRDALIEYGVDCPICVIPTGIDIEQFLPESNPVEKIAKLKTELGVPNSSPVVITVGRLAEEKSVNVIINGFAELLKNIPQAYLIVVGGGPALDTLKSQASSVGIFDRVIFTGFIPWSEIGKYYRLGDVFVSASTSETQGLTYFESMAAQVPVIAKRDLSIENIIDNGITGFLFDENDELPVLLSNVLSDIALRQNVAKSAFKNVRLLSAGDFGKRIESLYNEYLYPKLKTSDWDNISPSVQSNVIKKKI